MKVDIELHRSNWEGALPRITTHICHKLGHWRHYMSFEWTNEAMNAGSNRCKVAMTINAHVIAQILERSNLRQHRCSQRCPRSAPSGTLRWRTCARCAGCSHQRAPAGKRRCAHEYREHDGRWWRKEGEEILCLRVGDVGDIRLGERRTWWCRLVTIYIKKSRENQDFYCDKSDITHILLSNDMFIKQDTMLINILFIISWQHMYI